jgi:putative hydrolase of the HAD superfamily
MPLAAVTLDAAGTLFAPREPVGETYARAARIHGIVADAATTDDRFRTALRVAPPLAFPGVPADRRLDAERAWWRAVVRQSLPAGVPSPALEACFADLWDHFARADAWSLDGDALHTLRTLRGRGLRLAVVSNFDGRLVPLLAALGVTPLLDAVLPSSAHDAAKPDPRLFHAAARFLAARPADILHVGDDVQLDVRGALGAGFRAILLTHDGGSAPDGVPVLRRLRDLPGALGQAC